MPPPRRNLELKAHDPDPARSLEVCESLDAEDHGVLHQRDTYFEVQRGRLKLRRQRGATAQLIAYRRPDTPGRKESRYEIVEIEDCQGIERALAGALGILAVVSKTRRLLIVDGVRIHLDTVEGLGSFIELEAVADPDDDISQFEGPLLDLRRSLGIDDRDLVGGSYCDLVRARSG